MVLGVASASEGTMVRQKTSVCRGDVVEVDLDPTKGREMAKTRPCLVVSNNTANRFSSLITVVVISSQAPSKQFPFMVEIPRSANMPKRSWANCAHIRTIDKGRLTTRYYTSLDKATMSEVDDALKTQLGLL